MMKITKLTLAFAAFALVALAQTTVPSTTFCAAVTKTATTVCLASTTNVVNQTGLYADGEYMTVLLGNSQTLASTNAYVPVSRGNRSGQPATAHANGAVVWLALTPDKANTPGDNGFQYSTNMTDIGPCTPGAISYLPHIWPDLAEMRTCGAINGGTTGQWVNYTVLQNQNPTTTPLQLLSTNAALPVTTGTYVITKAGVLAATLAAPTAGSQDGIVIQISSTTANAHTLTATGLLQTGTASVNVATFAAQAGAGLVLMSYNGKWIVLSSVGITFS
jgi:hypothetical protein